jgi:glycosyltransferase involved in cell wall biosynthesis
MPPVVSACIVTYQHARFIRKAVEGALMQETNFGVEILVGEDESTDGTREICLELARLHPDRVKVFLRQRKDVVHIDGEPRGSFNFRKTIAEAKGEFVAICEGDDFWEDPTKLQRQVDYLRANPDCVGCFHDAKLVDAEGATLAGSYFQSSQEKFSQRDVLETLLSREPTCSLMFRRSAFAEPLPEWYLRRPCDLYLDILLTNSGPLGFIGRTMAAYRRHSGGIWSGQRESKQLVELIIRLKLLLADAFFLREFGDVLKTKIAELEAALFTRDDFGTEMRRLQETTAEQRTHIEVLEKERSRLTAEAVAAREQASASFEGYQQHINQLLDQIAVNDRLRQVQIDDLIAQLGSMGESAQKQDELIKLLSHERDRLTAQMEKIATDSAHYAKVMAEQTSYIRALEKILAEKSPT